MKRRFECGVVLDRVGGGREVPCRVHDKNFVLRNDKNKEEPLL